MLSSPLRRKQRSWFVKAKSIVSEYRIEYYFIVVLCIAFCINGSLKAACSNNFEKCTLNPARIADLVVLNVHVMTIPFSLITLSGLLVPLRRKVKKVAEQPYLVVRYVTRGDSPHLVKTVVAHARKILEQCRDLGTYRIEVVTDKSLDLDCEIVVPKDYVTPNGTLYKARALQYALSFSDCPHDSHILHLDEESMISVDLIESCNTFIVENPSKIGQGIIRYDRNWKKNGLQSLMCTLAETNRIADDLGRFHITLSTGYPYTGLKGSFLLIPNWVEKEMTLDQGPEGSIAEDAFFAIRGMGSNLEFGFIDAVLDEGSCFTFADFVRQRKRWCIGIWLCLFYAPTKFHVKVALAIHLMIWCCVPIGAFFLPLVVTLKFSGIVNLDELAIIEGFNAGVGLAALLIAFFFYSNLPLYLFPLQLAAMPLTLIMETCGMVYALVKPSLDFYVVRKE